MLSARDGIEVGVGGVTCHISQVFYCALYVCYISWFSQLCLSGDEKTEPQPWDLYHGPYGLTLSFGWTQSWAIPLPQSQTEWELMLRAC